MFPTRLKTFLSNRTVPVVIRAVKAHRVGEWTKALEGYQKAVRRYPLVAQLWFQVGEALAELERYPEALAAYHRADRLRPRSAHTHFQMAKALHRSGRLEDALAGYERALELKPGDVTTQHEVRKLRILVRQDPMKSQLEHLRFVNIGTTGTCNASCVHCPTGKLETAHAPRGTMPMPLFQKIIDGIAEHNIVVTDQIAFGLFGDGLVDPLVVQRARYVREKLPHVRLSVNTNGASFNMEKHGELQNLAFTIALHCESLIPEVYEDLMRPLRAERVFPKFELIMKTFPGKVMVSVPVSRRNIDELPAIRRWFLERGAKHVQFDPLSSRCSKDRTVFDALALDPKPIACGPDIMDDLIVDCDGKVLSCCQDFQRRVEIGDMETQSFEEVLTGVRREGMRKLLAEKRHSELETCSRCFADIRGELVVA